MITTFPQRNFSMEFPEILSQDYIPVCYHWLSTSEISKVMHCGILINMPYCPNSLAYDTEHLQRRTGRWSVLAFKKVWGENIYINNADQSIFIPHSWMRHKWSTASYLLCSTLYIQETICYCTLCIYHHHISAIIILFNVHFIKVIPLWCTY